MATIDQVKKHYDKLTARERFALIVAAGARDDQAERTALISSAPKVAFQVPHTYGLSDGFEFLTSYHLMQQLGTAGMFFMLIHFDDGETIAGTIDTIDGKSYTLADAILITARRFIEGREAYKAVCAEYGVDPETLTSAWDSYPDLQTMTELVIRSFNTDNPMELTDLQTTIETYKKVIEAQRAKWE